MVSYLAPMPRLQAGSAPRTVQEGPEGMLKLGCCGEWRRERAIALQAKETPLHPNGSCKRGERWIRRWRCREREIQTGRLAERQRPRVMHLRRGGQSQIGPEIQRERQRTETNGLGYTVPRPSQHKGQLEATHLPEKPLPSSAARVSAVRAYHTDRSVCRSLISNLRALQTPAINCNLPE